MKEGIIRPLAICVFRNNDRILVAEGYDPVKQQTFYRPLGGSIEFGERAAGTIARELMEEIGAAVCDLRYLGTLENIFTYAGKRGHEIVLVFDGRFVGAAIYARGEFFGIEKDDEHELRFKAVWKSLDEFHPERAPVYPDGLVELLARSKRRRINSTAQ